MARSVCLAGRRWLVCCLGRDGKGSRSGSVFLYRSSDLMNWKFVSILATYEEENRRTFECPNFFELGDKWVLIVSPCAKVIYTVGTFENYEFIHGDWHILDNGRIFYAPNSMVDPQNRRILWGWLKMEGKGNEQGGWAGCHTLPRILTLNDDQTLRMFPAPELVQLRSDAAQIDMNQLASSENYLLDGIDGVGCEIQLLFIPQDADLVGVRIARAVDGEDDAFVTYIAKTNQLQVGEELFKLPQIDSDALIALHIFVDRGVIEAYLNQRECYSVQIYPDFEGPTTVAIIQQGGFPKIMALEAWNLESIW